MSVLCFTSFWAKSLHWCEQIDPYTFSNRSFSRIIYFSPKKSLPAQKFLQLCSEVKKMTIFFLQESGRQSRRQSGAPGEHRGSTTSAAPAVTQKVADAKLRQMLSTLVHEANFLVEDNLNDLVDDIPDNEKTLFKLDSILTAIGEREENMSKIPSNGNILCRQG